MKVGNGIVKKYSREYNRTLKDGTKKKYITEQIQITVPKNKDIYENGEKVLIIPQCEIENFYDLKEELYAIQVANYLYKKEVEKLEQQLNEINPECERHINELKKELQEKENEIKYLEKINLEIKKDTVAILKEENETIKTKHSILVDENENIKSKYYNMKIENENLKTKYSNIEEENKNLWDKCSDLKEKHEEVKNSYNQITDKYDN